MADHSSSPSASASPGLHAPANLKVVGIILAIASGVLIGSSFVLKKKGLLRSQQGGVAGEGVAYLKSVLWWSGMIMMILGEICNFAAYAFVEAIVVTPMGALSVVISAILSSWFLKEKLSFFGWLGCGLCIIGSVIIALNGPQEQAIGQIREFQKLFLAPGFLVYGSILILASLVIIFYFAPRYGKKNMLWYIMVCSMIGGISVSVTTGLGSAIVTSAMGDNQFKYWFTYFLMAFIAVTLVTEVYYLNVALALFNTAMVTPTYYVTFTFFSIVTTVVLFKGLKAPVVQIITLVMGFVVICFGITILQLSKVDPTQIKALDRRSTMLLQAARQNTEGYDEKNLTAIEDPGMDALRGSFGTIGSIVRAKSARRMSMSSRNTSTMRSRNGVPHEDRPSRADSFFQGMRRHQLYDPPMHTPDREGSVDRISLASQPGRPSQQRVQTIKFGDQDLIHSYHTPGTGDDSVIHEARPSYIPMNSRDVPPLPQLSPPPEVDEETPLSAPPMLSGLDFHDPFARPHPIDPFANSPSTTTLATFPSSISSIASEPDSLRAVVGLTSSPERERPPSFHHSTPPRPAAHTHTSSTGSHHHNIFGRGRSPHKGYPRGDEQDDRDESISLVHTPNEERDAEVQSVETADTELGEDVSKKSIRLVPSPNRF
ncbi:magnesium transporter NIPA-domain-containing protein [Cristinia sonorae]|uniref:Magnesium transporter NIPA-domain-containing protein n=1 Tax=Cristinia sonorae TaxID=1940300 RepID=A0A8K0UFJ3_9AGAR|nr:magnesium transporter NIPA-domain-containing protein [Cristinia sonorae]